MTDNMISAEYPFKSNYIDVLGAKLHYIDEGSGQPMLFLHGIPTWSYLWRNVIPCLSNQVRCIAPDLIGMGRSDKPDIDYRVFDHIKHIEAFIEALGLKNITFVMHGWGSVIGFDIAMRHPEWVAGLVFYESHVRPAVDWNMLALPVQQLATLLDHEDASYRAVVRENYLVEKLLPRGVLRKLTDQEMQFYREPFTSESSRKPLWQYLQDLPLGDGPEDVVALISNYSKKLQQSEVPKLMLYAIPGFITTVATLEWCRDHLPNLKMIDLEDGLHFAQETKPQEFADVVASWYAALQNVPIE